MFLDWHRLDKLRYEIIYDRELELRLVLSPLDLLACPTVPLFPSCTPFVVRDIS